MNLTSKFGKLFSNLKPNWWWWSVRISKPSYKPHLQGQRELVNKWSIFWVFAFWHRDSPTLGSSFYVHSLFGGRKSNVHSFVHGETLIFVAYNSEMAEFLFRLRAGCRENKSFSLMFWELRSVFQLWFSFLKNSWYVA